MDEMLSLILTIFSLSCIVIYFLSLSIGKVLKSIQICRITVCLEYRVGDASLHQEGKGVKVGNRRNVRPFQHAIGRRDQNQAVHAA